MLSELRFRQIKNSRRTAQAVAAFRSEPLNYLVLHEVLEMVGDYGELTGACDCQYRKMSYWGSGDRGNYLPDVKTRFNRQGM